MRRGLLAAVGGGAGFLTLLLALSMLPYRGYEAPEVIVTVPSGASAAQVARTLGAAGVIRSPTLFRWGVRLAGTGSRLHAGEYRFAGAMGPLAVHRKLVRGDVLLHRVTIPEGLRIDEVFDLLVGAGLAERSELESVRDDPDLLSLIHPEARDLEGYLFPDTYRFARGLAGREILSRLLVRFGEVVGSEERIRAEELGFSIPELITLASLVEEETADPAERPLVASVFHNRLRRGMLLQCDPTVVYALVRAGVYEGRLTRQGLAFDSPYNTYLYPGLPPGPIASPGEGAIRAALQPADTDYLYFVSRNDGTHQFSVHLGDHNRAVDRYQRRRR